MSVRAAEIPTTKPEPLRVASGLGVSETTTTRWPNGSFGWDISATTRDACQSAIDAVMLLIDERGGAATFTRPTKSFGASWIAAGRGHFNQ